ncbi:MAG: NIPSNAP family protein [Cytophagales bacterium CG18_big_fil_WC_8_21_14_2_50_42_9]|nr:MAG: NIPSNAP family protein [Cytophagales bacterium CG18_big_fil_WC_8_21_14_2_50_42_9]
MKHLFFSLFILLAITAGCKTSSKSSSSVASVPDNRFYEMRVYYAAPGKLADLNTRFRNHTTRIFEKHGMTNIGYWEPIDNTENKLIYMLAYPSKEARDASWKAFGADPEWQAVAKASEANGKIVDKVDSWYLQATDYSPVIQPSNKQPRVFELRTYTASPNNIENLHSRFRDHTVKLFEKHGMTNIGYWRPADNNSDKKDMLVYILAHPTPEAGAAAFQAFRQDPDWVKAMKASEEKGGGSLTTKVESVYMRATDYSPIQ